MVKAKMYLERIKHLDMAIDNKADEIKVLRNKVYRITSSTNRREVQECNMEKSALESGIVRIISEEEELNKLIDQFVDEKEAVRKVIRTIGNISYQLLLEMRYFNYYNWTKISEKMNYSASYVYKQHHLAIKAFEKQSFLYEKIG